MKGTTNYTNLAKCSAFDEVNDFAACAANEYELLRYACKDVNRLPSIRGNSDVYVPNSESKFVSFV